MNTNGDPHQKCIWSKRGNICDCILMAKRVSALYLRGAEFTVLLSKWNFRLNKTKIVAIIKLASENVIQNLLIEYIPVFRTEIFLDVINKINTDAMKAKHAESNNTLVDDFNKIKEFRPLGPIKINAMKIIVPSIV